MTNLPIFNQNPILFRGFPIHFSPAIGHFFSGLNNSLRPDGRSAECALLPVCPRFLSALVVFVFLNLLLAVARAEPQGIVIYQAPATAYTETMECRSFHQDNALYSTIITNDGQRKQVKSGGVLAVVPYPPAGFDIYFADTAKAAIAKLGTMEGSYPAVQGRLEQVRGKWARALSVFQQQEQRSLVNAPTPAGRTEAHVVETAAASPATFSSPASATAAGDENLTDRIEKVGRGIIGSCSRMLGIADRTFSVWTFFVVLPALVITLLLMIICLALRPPVTRFSPGRSRH